jgi:hypothetical protein
MLMLAFHPQSSKLDCMVSIAKLNKLHFGLLCYKFVQHGVPDAAEIIPFEPDPDNAGVGIGINEINQAISL